MNEKISVTLNGKKCETTSEKTILELAREQGINIPTLCQDNRLQHFSSCFICAVEVENSKTGLLPSCSTKLVNSMVIHTASEKVQIARKTALDLMLSDHTGDCIAPCVEHCPAHTDVQGYVAHVANGDFMSALKLIKSRLALPLVCGTICPNPCEAQCRRGLVDEPIAIRAVKRSASLYDLEYGPYIPTVATATGKKVDVVGGGTAGLAAAYYLRQKGHEVHIHEALPELGGMTRYGIPKFRLPWNLLDAEIKSIIDTGIEVHTNSRLGKDFTLSDLKKNGADAILIAVGAHASKPMRIENEKSPGVMGGVEFLRKVVMGEKIETGKKVAIIGGGDVAMDCARVAKRLGTDVSLLYRRSQAEMPALHHEQEETKEEGVSFRYLTAPVSVILENDRAKYLRVVKMQLGAPDASGRRSPEPILGSEEDLQFDLIISAIGQDPDLSFLEKENEKPEVTKWKTLVYDPQTGATKLKGIFTAGDCAFGPNTVVQALAEGRNAALAIDQFLNGQEIKAPHQYAISRGRIEELNREDFAPRFEQRKRAQEIVHPAEKRLEKGGYEAINIALNAAQASAESSRCIECGCQARFNCALRDYSTEYRASEKTFVGKKRSYETDKRHPWIKFEQDKCITCGSCVRMCKEVRKIEALTFVQRGFATHIAPVFESPLSETNCDSCGMCIDVCPTGAISCNTDKSFGPWPSQSVLSACTLCGRACPINVHFVDDKVIKIESTKDSIICKDGRFAHLVPAPLPIGDIKAAQKIVTSGKGFALVISPTMTIEEIRAAAKLCKNRGGELFYFVDEKTSAASYPYAKESGHFNLKIFDELHAQKWNNDSNKPVLCIAPVALQTKVDVFLPVAGHLYTQGHFIGIDGAEQSVNTLTRRKTRGLEIIEGLSP